MECGLVWGHDWALRANLGLARDQIILSEENVSQYLLFFEWGGRTKLRYLRLVHTVQSNIEEGGQGVKLTFRAAIRAASWVSLSLANCIVASNVACCRPNSARSCDSVSTDRSPIPFTKYRLKKLLMG